MFRRLLLGVRGGLPVITCPHGHVVDLYTSRQAAGLLHRSEQHIRLIAQRLELGWRPNPRITILTAAEVDRIREHLAANPRTATRWRKS